MYQNIGSGPRKRARLAPIRALRPRNDRNRRTGCDKSQLDFKFQIFAPDGLTERLKLDPAVAVGAGIVFIKRETFAQTNGF
jgi:hypothetical protein